MKTIIHVNQHVIKANAKNGENNPTLTVKTYKSNQYAHEVFIDGPSKVVYSPDKPLQCGAKVWIETDSEVTCKIVCERCKGTGEEDSGGVYPWGEGINVRCQCQEGKA